MGYLRKRFAEPSSWAGLAAILANATQAYAEGGKGAATAAVVMGTVAFLAPDNKATPVQ